MTTPRPTPRNPTLEVVIRLPAVTAATCACLALVAPATARSGTLTRPQPTLLARISRQIFGPRWRVAVCIAHYESTDGAHLYNGPNVGPWQISVSAHPQYSAARLAADWWYSARAAYTISHGGRDWRAWSTHSLCGV